MKSIAICVFAMPLGSGDIRQEFEGQWLKHLKRKVYAVRYFNLAVRHD